MSKHTKGPWKWKSDPRMGGFHVYMDTAIRKRSGYASHHHLEMDFSIYPEDGEQWEEAKANARLIAAAPTGLDAAIFVYERLLSHPVDSWRIGVNGQQSLCVLRDFIADATGQTEQEVQEFYEAKIAGAA